MSLIRPLFQVQNVPSEWFVMRDITEEFRRSGRVQGRPLYLLGPDADRRGAGTSDCPMIQRYLGLHHLIFRGSGSHYAYRDDVHDVYAPLLAFARSIFYLANIKGTGRYEFYLQIIHFTVEAFASFWDIERLPTAIQFMYCEIGSKLGFEPRIEMPTNHYRSHFRDFDRNGNLLLPHKLKYIVLPQNERLRRLDPIGRTTPSPTESWYSHQINWDHERYHEDSDESSFDDDLGNPSDNSDEDY